MTYCFASNPEGRTNRQVLSLHPRPLPLTGVCLVQCSLRVTCCTAASPATSGWYCHGVASALPRRCPPSRWLLVADSCSICWMVMHSLQRWRGSGALANAQGTRTYAVGSDVAGTRCDNGGVLWPVVYADSAGPVGLSCQGSGA